MVLFKINGERNSGTNFLENILRINYFPTYVQKKKKIRIMYQVGASLTLAYFFILPQCRQLLPCLVLVFLFLCRHIPKKDIVYHWKHGVPSEDYKELNEMVVDIFIFRNLEDWLISCWQNNHHLRKYYNFKDFLTLPQISNESRHLDYRTNKSINEDDNGKTIFQIREYKFNKIIEYKKNNKDVILVNLSFIQDPKNLSQFLDFLADKYIPKLKVNNYINNIKHTKDNSNNKNRTYKININEYRDVIDSNLNEEIENFINNLTFI